MSERATGHAGAVMRALFAAALLVLALAASGCAEPGPVDTTVSAPQPPAEAAPAPDTAPATLRPLTPTEKRSAIGPAFPAEVPVPAGEFTRATEQNGDAWDYEVLVEGAPAAVAAWYREAYVGRQWVLVQEGDVDGADGPGRFFVFRKGDAESRVSIYGADDVSRPESARVIVVLGVGAPVLLTQ